nr:homeodomain transcription factor bW [Pseudozyma pruni]
MTATTIFAQIHHLASSICDALPDQSGSALNSLDIRTTIPPLRLKHAYAVNLESQLSRFALSQQGRHNVLEIFERTRTFLAETFQCQYEHTAKALRDTAYDDQRLLDDFEKSMSKEFARRVLQLEQELMTAVAETLGRSDEHSKQCQPVIRYETSGRGHHSDAVRILEQAFAHTPNITQAEKYRLAEVTGLQPKQVTIWQFQNRRNRKCKKTFRAEPTPTPSTCLSPSERHATPPASPTRDFTLSEKKRKSYGALGCSPPEYTDSEADSPSSILKKPRLPSCESDSSDVSTSSSEYPNAFIPWSSPSSRSTSSSSASSGASDYSDSPTKPHNVFKYISPLRYDVEAKAAMPSLTLATQQLSVQPGLAQGQRSPFTIDNQEGIIFKSESMDFGGLQLPDMLHDTELMRSVQEALAMHSAESCSSRSVSSSSWNSQQVTTDDDGWFDEDDRVAPLAGRHVTPVDGTAASQTSAAHSSFQSIDAAALHATPPAARPQATNTSPDSSFSYPASSEDESFGLVQLFNPAASTHIPSSSPLPPPPTGDAAVDTPNFNVDIEMDDIQQFLDTDIFASSLPSTQQSTQSLGHGAGGAEMQRADGMQGGHPAEAQFFMNFDLSSQAFMPI